MLRLNSWYNTPMQKQSVWEKYPQLQKIPKDKFPRHIFIIPDGNGRWAKDRGKFVTEGHKKGFQAAYEILKILSDVSEIKILTIFGFSADNWKRSEKEIHGLMLLFENVIKNTLKDLLGKNGRFVHLGRKDRIPKRLLRIIQDAEERTKDNTGQIVCLAIDFGGEDQDIRIVEKAIKENIKIPITQDILWKLRDGQGLIPPADLLVRTSGEIRTSDIGWINGAPTELYFTPKYFPDITPEDIIAAIIDFSKRERRFGGRK